MKILPNAALASLFILANSTAQGALFERLGGLAYYDDVSNLTWLTDGNYAKTSGYDSDGMMSWSQATTWVSTLNVEGVTGWRLPSTLETDPTCTPTASASAFNNCTGSEMGNLFYNVLGGTAGNSLNAGHNANYDLFSNIELLSYWSGTEMPMYFDSAWYFEMHWGFQGYFNKDAMYSYAWAIHDGDVGASAVPVPAATWLFGSGLIGLMGFAKRKSHK